MAKEARRLTRGARSRATLAAACLACAFAATAAVAAPGDNKPKADFTSLPAAPLTGETVTFISTSVLGKSNNPITAYAWDLDGDGSFETNTGTSSRVARSYPTPRTVNVGLQVTDSAGKTATAQHPVTIANREPTATFAWSPPFPLPGQPVTFTSTAADPDGSIASQAWDLDGDGNFDNGSGVTALRSFAAGGSYVVGLRTTDDRGASSFLSKTVTVQSPSQPGTPVSKQSGSRPRLISPFPVVRIAGRITHRGALLRLLVVSAPKGTKVSVRCGGHGCPFKKQVRAAARIRVKRLERLLPAGVVVKVYVTKRGFIGKYTRFKIRGGAAPARTDRCLPPGSWKPVRCPAG